MIEWLRQQGKLSDRKARLFSVACCRRVWSLITDERSRAMVGVLERAADGLASTEEFVEAAEAAAAVAWELDAISDEPGRPHGEYEAAWAVWEATWDANAKGCAAQAAGAVAWDAAGDDYGPDAGVEPERQERAAQAEILRDLFSPCRSPLPRTWPAAVVLLASQAYEHRMVPEGTLDTVRVSVLAERLADAGCDDAKLLEHLRGPGPHWRGCHALDVIFGKA